MQVKQSQKIRCREQSEKAATIFQGVGVGDSWGYGFICYKLSLAIFIFLVKRKKDPPFLS
jgi:hypothetical protein